LYCVLNLESPLREVPLYTCMRAENSSAQRSAWISSPIHFWKTGKDISMEEYNDCVV